MAQEGSEASVASSSPTPNWWEIHTNPVSAWNSMDNNRWLQPHSNSSNNNCEDQDHFPTNSFTNASNKNSGLSMDSTSSADLDLDLDLSREPAENNNLWSQLLFGNIGNGGEGGGNLHNNHEHIDRENFLELLSSKSLATEMFNPACNNYLKKLDSSWDQLPITNQSNISPLDNYNNASMIQPERLNNLSDLVSNWSIAPPNTTYPSLVPHYSIPNLSQIKDELPNLPSSCYLSSYNLHDNKGENHNSSESTSPLLRPIISSSNGMGFQQADISNSAMELNTRYLSDLISFGSCLNKAPAMEFRASKPSVKGSEESLSGSKKQVYDTSSSTKGSGRSSGTISEGKKKRCGDISETPFKKSKHESSNVSSPKLQAPKVKLGDRITALQQIVSPFGKTDTASVLLEAINYIKFLQEQVQLLTDPYIKSSTQKDPNSWGDTERKDKAETNLDLRSRGLCLVPISCTPQACQENTGPDYWTPTYRGCLYR